MLLTKRIARYDAIISAITPGAKSGDEEAKVQLLDLQAQRKTALEERRRLQPPAEQCKTLTKAKKTREGNVEKSERAFVAAKLTATFASKNPSPVMLKAD